MNTRVVKIDPAEHRVHLSDGELLRYSKLVLCTGGSPRLLSIPGRELSGIHYVRKIDDVKAIRAEVQQRQNKCRVVIIGGGYIGLETAAMMRSLGLDVTLLQSSERLLRKVVAPEVSAFFQQLHELHGVKVVTDAKVSALTGNGRVEQVHCENGQIFQADLVVVGIGITPNTELAIEAGLKVDDGIVVNASCETSEEDIYAAGDCVHFMNVHYQRLMRLESVQNAVDQTKVIAANICGKSSEYNQLPWFWSDQYDVKFQIAGLSEGYDEVVFRGELKASTEGDCKFAAFYLKNGYLQAVDAVNSPQDFMFGKRLILAKSLIDKSRLQDKQVPLKDLLPVK